MNTNNQEYIGKYISHLYRKGRCFISKELIEQGVGSGQFIFLLQLYKQDGINQEELSDILCMDKGTTARAIKKLEVEGFVTRSKDDTDKRAYKIYLTEKAIENKSTICKVLQQWEDNIMKNITLEEKDILIELLKKICV